MLTLKDETISIIVNNGMELHNDQEHIPCDGDCNKSAAVFHLCTEDMSVTNLVVHYTVKKQLIKSIDEYGDVNTGRKMHTSGQVGIMPMGSTTFETKRELVSKQLTYEFTYWYVGKCQRCGHEHVFQIPKKRTLTLREYL